MIPRKSGLCGTASPSVITLLLAVSCCSHLVSGFQVATLKQQQQHISKLPQQLERQQTNVAAAVAATTTALAVRHQHKRHNLGQELNVQQQTSRGEASASSSPHPKSAKSNHRLVSKLKDARHRRRNRHHRHRHHQKMGANSGGAQDRQPDSSMMQRAQPSAAAAAAFAAMTAMAAEPGVQSASSNALIALESIVEEVARVGVQQLVSAGSQVPTNSAQSSSAQAASSAPQAAAAGGQQQQQQASPPPSAAPAPTSASSLSTLGSDLLLNGSMAPVTSLQPAPSPPQSPLLPNTHPAANQIQTPAQAPQPTGHHLTRGPLHSTRSFLLTSTLSKIYNLLNVTEFALEMRDGISSRASCVACNAVVGLFLSPLYSKEVFSAAIRTVCISFRIQSARVCAGLVESFQDDFEYIRKNTKLTRDEVCGVVFGIDCARRQTYNLFWTVPIPEMPASLAANLNSKRPQVSALDAETSTPTPIPMDEHSLAGMEDAPDLFEYRRSNIASSASSPPPSIGGGPSSSKEQPGQKAGGTPASGGLDLKQQQEAQAVVAVGGQASEQEQNGNNKMAKALKRPQYIFDDNNDHRPMESNGEESTTDQQRPKLSSFVHLTDIHIDPYYEAGSLNECSEPLCCRATSGPAPSDKRRQAGRWGDYGNCDVPVRTLRNALERIREKHSDAEYWLWTGDISPHDIWNISKSEAANHVRLVTKMVRDYSNGLPVFPVIGNHEAHPVNSFSPPEIKGKFSMSWLYDLLADEWSEWLPEDAIRTLKIGGYYKLQVRKGLRILALNTNYCARLNPWSFFDPVDPAGQLKWLVNELLEAELNQDKVHIIGHVPPDNRECTQSWLFNFINIVDRFRDTILAQFYGHTHRDEWRVIYSLARADEPIGIQYIGPSITPFTENNPSYRIYHQDKQGYIHDSETFYFNLTEANETPTSEPRWRFSYSNRHHLNMTQGLSAQTFHQYLQKLQEDDEAFEVFHKNFYRYSDVKVGQVCKNKCKHQLLSDLRLSHPYKTKPKPFLSNRKTSNHHHHSRDHHHHHHKRLRHHQN